MGSLKTVIIVRYGEIDVHTGRISPAGVSQLQNVAKGVRSLCAEIKEVYYLFSVQGRMDMFLTARILAADLLANSSANMQLDPSTVEPEWQAGAVAWLLEALSSSAGVAIVVVNSGMSGELAHHFTKGWPSDCVAILDPGRAYVLNLVDKTHYSL